MSDYIVYSFMTYLIKSFRNSSISLIRFDKKHENDLSLIVIHISLFGFIKLVKFLVNIFFKNIIYFI